MINKITLIGNIGQAPETKKLESGATVTRMSVATNESYRDKSGEWQQETQWHTVICWNKLSEKVEEYEKGALVYVEGKMTYRTYEDSNGVKRTSAEVKADYVRYMSGRSETAAPAKPVPAPQAQPATNNPVPADDLPF